MTTINHLASKAMKRIRPPRHEGPYPERDADLVRALRRRFDPDIDDPQPLILEAYRAGWSIAEAGRAIETIKAEWRALP
ncbi:hypothetical protein LJR231_003537 [Phyllobacterium sp. LjRoot231]|uniref:hypothetical protein n=1 Tax=Phyllobacterium sp. LjRoot231 TaxID=3342289 RepID=UPI003ED146FD